MLLEVLAHEEKITETLSGFLQLVRIVRTRISTIRR